ncbi:purine/pyrimidine permease [Alicyclobacillus fastidiosus]|uniref:Purine/pyrimidine permease n=1 Tax=Alicyclobacillus fastidiosus TaxID=392011 RepID=A0ABV5AL75_9BACL|nr:purine/pyrimidine permease [Alicyclobacillus fastidiosus]WEH09389.1 purine/pyrimidine permease [Alicyclobacillus fastidiosus]
MEGLRYGLNDKPKNATLILSSVQWFVFSLANVITVPIVLGHAFGLSESGIALYTERSFFICGLVGLLQALIGHGYAIIEGPAGMWWGVFLVLIQMTKDEHGSLQSLLQDLEFGLIIAGVVFIVLGATGLLAWIRKLFTPVVTGTFLVLLALQVSKSLVEGVLGIGFRNRPTFSPEIALLSVLLMVLTIFLMFKARGIIQSIAVLIGLVVGWIVYAMLGLVDTPHTAAAVFSVPSVFPFGPPKFHMGVSITCVITAVILLSNLIASVQAFAGAAHEIPSSRAYNRGSVLTGVGTALSGIFGVAGVVPLTAAASLVALTGIASRLPFIIASAAVALLGFFPFIGQWVATLPAPAGYAILFTVFAQLLGFGLRDYKQLALDQRDVFVISIAVLTGVGIYFIPATAWLGLPAVLSYLLDNGLIIGIVLVLIFEHVVFRRSAAK